MDNATHNSITSNSLRTGDVGLAIYAGADPSAPCVKNGAAESHSNIFEGNHSIGFNTGIVLGTGSNSKSNVYKNDLNYNKIYDDNTGIFFNTDAHNNNATNNAYSGTITPIFDVGVGNDY